MAKKPVVEVVVVQGNRTTIRAAVVAYFGAEKKCFAAWSAFFGNMDETASGIAYKLLLEEIRTTGGTVLKKAECSKDVLLEYHRVATSKSRFIADKEKKAAGKNEPSTWYARDHELAGKKIKFLQAMKPEKTGGKKVDRLVVAWQVVAELTK